jgi:hypothetical protein
VFSCSDVATMMEPRGADVWAQRRKGVLAPKTETMVSSMPVARVDTFIRQ